jgi:hypothetical protein
MRIMSEFSIFFAQYICIRIVAVVFYIETGTKTLNKFI